MSSSPIRRRPFSAESIRKYNALVLEAMDAAKSIPVEDIHVYISTSNTKTGDIPSFSTLSGLTCAGCHGVMEEGGCGWYCYDKAAVIQMGRKNILASRARNTRLIMSDPERAFSEISKECYKFRFFRWHVGGEIPNPAYVVGMCTVAAENPHCQFLVFTKNHHAVNECVKALHNADMEVPGNLRIVFSLWPGMPHENPFRFPEASPLFADGSSGFSDLENCFLCENSCQQCLLKDCGCFNAKPGDKILFNLH